MSRRQFFTMATLLLAAGCGSPPDDSSRNSAEPKVPDTTAALPDTLAETGPSPETQEPGGPRCRQGNLKVTVYNTGDVAVWPTYDLPPAVIEFDLPEVPDRIKGPFTEQDLLTVE